MNLQHPPAEVAVDADLVGSLLRDQFPDLAGGEPALVDEGWDNFTFRLGADLAVRLPRRKIAVQLLLNEQRWLPQLAEWLAVDVPLPVRVGRPSERFPWPWSVVRWIEGETADRSPLRADQGPLLAETLKSLHRVAPPEAPQNPYRGVALASRRDGVAERIRRLGLGQLDAAWQEALRTLPDEDRVWLHGDLHPRNIVSRGGELAGIIDWGDMTAGDPATDLACAWTLFEADGRAALLAAYGPTDAEFARAKGWAVLFGTVLVGSSEPRHASIGRAIVRRLVETA